MYIWHLSEKLVIVRGVDNTQPQVGDSDRRWKRMEVIDTHSLERRRKRVRVAAGVGLLLATVGLTFGIVLMKSMETRSDLLPVGHIAPDFFAKTSNGEIVHLADMRKHKRVVLVFYPGDYTPLCTAQLCSFRDNWDALQTEDAIVFGVNPAEKEKHAGFAAKNRLPFPLIVDRGNEIARAYGCRAMLGIVKRTVYILDRQGHVAWVKRGNPAPSEVLRVLHDLKDNF